MADSGSGEPPDKKQKMSSPDHTPGGSNSGIGMPQSNMLEAQNNPQMSQQTMDHIEILPSTQQQMIEIPAQPLQNAGVAVQLQAPAGPARPGQPQSVDPEKRRLVQQLSHLLHAHMCQRRPLCRNMKKVLNHMTTCDAGQSCLVAHCASSQKLVIHWKNCTRHDCPVCLPLRRVSNRQRQPGAPQSNATTIGPQTTSVNSVGPPAVHPGMINARLKQAYASLGLQYNVQQAGGLQATNLNRTQGTGKDGQTNRGTKEWHQSVTQGQSLVQVESISVQAFFPTLEPTAVKDGRMNHLVTYAQKEEGDMYETATSNEPSFHFLVEKINKIPKELEEKQNQRQQEQQRNQAPGTANDIRPPASIANNLIGARATANGPMSTPTSVVGMPSPNSADPFLKDRGINNWVTYAQKDMYETATSKDNEDYSYEQTLHAIDSSEVTPLSGNNFPVNNGNQPAVSQDADSKTTAAQDAGSVTLDSSDDALSDSFEENKSRKYFYYDLDNMAWTLVFETEYCCPIRSDNKQEWRRN